MADSIKKEDKLHLCCVDLVVVIQVLLYDATHLMAGAGGREQGGGEGGGTEGGR